MQYVSIMVYYKKGGFPKYRIKKKRQDFMNSDRQYERTVELWRSYGIATSLELAAHLDNFAILFSYNSGKIENREITYHDTHEIFKNGRVCGYTGDLRTLYEIKNLKDASELMYRWFDGRKPITLDSIREMQFELTKGTYDERRWELGERPVSYTHLTLPTTPYV